MKYTIYIQGILLFWYSLFTQVNTLLPDDEYQDWYNESGRCWLPEA